MLGKVALVEFWAFEYCNFLHTIPSSEAWPDKFHLDSLSLIGVHPAEFAYEWDMSNVVREIRALEISYPVGLDNHYEISNA